MATGKKTTGKTIKELDAEDALQYEERTRTEQAAIQALQALKAHQKEHPDDAEGIAKLQSEAETAKKAWLLAHGVKG